MLFKALIFKNNLGILLTKNAGSTLLNQIVGRYILLFVWEQVYYGKFIRTLFYPQVILT